MRFQYGQTVTRLRAGTVLDPYSGQQAEDWDNPTELPVANCAVGPQVSTESHTVDGTRSEAEMGLYCADPTPPDVLRGDRVRDARGVTWTVEGDMVAWENPLTGWQPGSVATIRRL